MGIGTGMRGKDLQKFLVVAREFGVILLVRHTNADSLPYVGRPGYYPKPALLKAKTADMNPPAATRSVQGHMVRTPYAIAGLVVHPGMHPAAYKAGKVHKAREAWEQSTKQLAGGITLRDGRAEEPGSWAAWGVARPVNCAPAWRWRVDVDAASPHYGCLQLSNAQAGLAWSYVHGDYDLKDVIVPGSESSNQRLEGKVDGVKNYTPQLPDRPQSEFERVRTRLNQLMGAQMVQHGAEAQFAWHGDEPITVAFPDGSHVLLVDAMTVQLWYQARNRSVLADKGRDYANDRSLMFHFGPQGMFAPGKLPASSWG